MAVQGHVIAWVADHRKHHARTDEEGDPHSPHVGHGDGFMGALRGLLRRLRLAWNVVEISPERQAQKQAPKRAAVAA